MRVQKISVENFRNFEKLEIELPKSDFIVFVGPNGSGKTTILDAIAYCLSHQTGQLTSDKDSYNIECSLNRNDIRNGENKTIVKSELNDNKISIHIVETKEIDQNGVSYEVNPKEYFSEIRKQLLTNFSSPELPLLVYYRANRTALIERDAKPNNYYNKRLAGYQFSFSEFKSSFNSFENWYLNIENIENEEKVKNKDFNYEFQGLKIIRFAITEFISRIHNANYSNLRGDRSTFQSLSIYSDYSKNGNLVIDKGNIPLKLAQLSMGEKMILYIVSDIARRLAILNDFDALSLFKKGIVLIDELELHLHPAWQRSIVIALKKTFPGIQFIVTTHSPQILSNLNDHEIIILDKEKYYMPSTNPLGRDTNGILEEVFEVSDRPVEVKNLKDEIFQLLANNPFKLDEINSKLLDLKKIIAVDDPIIVRIENVIDRIKLAAR